MSDEKERKLKVVNGYEPDDRLMYTLKKESIKK